MKLLTVKQVADQLNISQATVYDLCAQRHLPHVRIGSGRGAIRIRSADVDTFIESCEVNEMPGKSYKFRHIDLG